MNSRACRPSTTVTSSALETSATSARKSTGAPNAHFPHDPTWRQVLGPLPARNAPRRLLRRARRNPARSGRHRFRPPETRTRTNQDIGRSKKRRSFLRSQFFNTSVFFVCFAAGFGSASGCIRVLRAFSASVRVDSGNVAAWDVVRVAVWKKNEGCWFPGFSASGLRGP